VDGTGYSGHLSRTDFGALSSLLSVPDQPRWQHRRPLRLHEHGRGGHPGTEPRDQSAPRRGGAPPAPIRETLEEGMRALSHLGVFATIAAASLCGLLSCGGARSTGDASGVDSAPAVSCTLDGGACPTGYRCACGGPGPVGACTCHKECSSTSECSASDPMCGCSSTDPAPRICVNACFCTCG